MNERTNMIISESLILWAFGCAVDHYDAASAVIALCAFAWIIRIYDTQDIKQLMIRGMLTADLCLILAHMSGLSAVIPSAGFVIAVNAFHAVMTVKNSYQLMDRAVRWFVIIFLAYTALSLIIPSNSFTFIQMLVLILLMFAPVSAVYAVRALSDSPAGDYNGSAIKNELE